MVGVGAGANTEAESIFTQGAEARVAEKIMRLRYATFCSKVILIL
jgi:hypothetical protein